MGQSLSFQGVSPNVKSMQIAIYDEEGLVACPTAGVRHSLDEVQRVLD